MVKQIEPSPEVLVHLPAKVRIPLFILLLLIPTGIILGITLLPSHPLELILPGVFAEPVLASLCFIPMVPLKEAKTSESSS